MADLARLVVRLEAESLKYQKELDKAQKKLSGFEKTSTKSVDIIKTAFAGLAAGATVAGFNSLVRSATDATAELAGLAQVANATTNEFQRYAVGANSVGISNEKLADIFKDVNDRVGDFLTTGAGPMVDFFEKIAPRVGVTAEQFAKLSGPQALQLYVSSLEKANVTQQEMTFYLEAMASDTTALLPLLRDGGAGIAEMADEADRMGLILSANTIAQAKEFKRQLGLLDRSTDNLKQRIVAEMTPALTEMSGFLLDIANDTQSAAIVSQTFDTVLKGVASAAIAVSTTFANVGRAIGGLAAAGAAAATLEFDRAGSIIDEFTADNEAATQKAEERIAKLWSGGYREAGDAAADAADRMEKAAQEAAAAQAEASRKFREETAKNEAASKASEAAAKAAAKARSDAVASLAGSAAQLQQQVDTMDLGEAATMRYRLAQGDLADTLKLAGSAGQKYADEMIAVSERMESLRLDSEMVAAELALVTEEIARGKQVFDATRTPLEQYQAAIAELNTLSHNGAISQDTYNRAVAAAQQSFEDASNSGVKFGITMEQIGETLGNNLQNTLQDFLFEPFADGTKSMTEQFSEMLRKMAAEIAAAEIMKFAFGAGGVGSGGGAIGQGLTALAGLFGMGARANGGPTNAATPYLVGERGPEIFVPNSNGQVMSNRDSGGWGGGNVTVNVSTNDEASFRRNKRQLGRAVQEGLA